MKKHIYSQDFFHMNLVIRLICIQFYILLYRFQNICKGGVHLFWNGDSMYLTYMQLHYKSYYKKTSKRLTI